MEGFAIISVLVMFAALGFLLFIKYDERKQAKHDLNLINNKPVWTRLKRLKD